MFNWWYQKKKKEACLADSEVIQDNKKMTKYNLTVPRMHYERRHFGTCLFAGCVFVGGGQNKQLLDKCEVYSTECSEWVEVASMNTKRNSFALIYFQDKVWAIGGISNGQTLNTIETYDLAENKWTTIDTKLLQRREGHGAVANNDKFFVIGGSSIKYEEVNSVELYSSQTNQFTFVTQMNIGRSYFGCCIFKNKILVYGGCFKTNCTDSVEVYDIENDVWSEGPKLPLPLGFFGHITEN